MSSRLFTAIAIAFSVAPVRSQSFNIDFGEPLDAPPPSYGAAGLAGQWNSIRAEPSTNYLLVDVAGVATNVQFHQYGATALVASSDPSVSARSATVGAPISPGETRYYFTIYRDPQAAGPCGNAASTINLSNAVAVNWVE